MFGRFSLLNIDGVDVTESPELLSFDTLDFNLKAPNIFIFLDEVDDKLEFDETLNKFSSLLLLKVPSFTELLLFVLEDKFIVLDDPLLLLLMVEEMAKGEGLCFNFNC